MRSLALGYSGLLLVRVVRFCQIADMVELGVGKFKGGGYLSRRINYPSMKTKVVYLIFLMLSASTFLRAVPNYGMDDYQCT